MAKLLAFNVSGAQVLSLETAHSYYSLKHARTARRIESQAYNSLEAARSAN